MSYLMWRERERESVRAWVSVFSPVDIIVVIVSNKTDIHPSQGQNGHQREKAEPAVYTLKKDEREQAWYKFLHASN